MQALKEIPAVNAEIDGQDIVYKNYYHIGIAVGTEKGLVVPVVRDADRLSIAGIEKAIADFGRRARDGKLKIEEMQGGTFTITNGGIYGSLMSTPILNAPQSGILGMHRIEVKPGDPNPFGSDARCNTWAQRQHPTRIRDLPYRWRSDPANAAGSNPPKRSSETLASAK